MYVLETLTCSTTKKVLKVKEDMVIPNVEQISKADTIATKRKTKPNQVTGHVIGAGDE